MKLRYYGHSCFSVEAGGKTLLFDPFISDNELARGIDPALVPADYVLISHGHFDHIADAEAIARRTGAGVVANYEIATWLGDRGLGRLHPMNHGGSRRFEFGRVKLVAAVHSSTLPDGSSGGNPGGFVVETGEGTFYYSGDTALTLDMRLVGESFRLSFAVLPIGDVFTMGVEDAIKAAGFIGCTQVLGVHYDTFPPIRIDHAEACARFRAAGMELHLLAPGQTHDFAPM